MTNFLLLTNPQSNPLYLSSYSSAVLLLTNLSNFLLLTNMQSIPLYFSSSYSVVLLLTNYLLLTNLQSISLNFCLPALPLSSPLTNFFLLTNPQSSPLYLSSSASSVSEDAGIESRQIITPLVNFT